METFGKIVRRGRFDNNEMGQEELAIGVGVSRTTISNIEAGKHNPSIVLATKIAQFLDFSLDSLK